MEHIFGYPITSKSKKDCIIEISESLESEKKGNYFVCACPHSLEIARSDYFFSSAIKNASLVIPDSSGIVLISKVIGGKIKNRITGYDIFLELSKVLNKRSNNIRYFFLGSTMENLVKIKERIKLDFPNIKVTGIYSPPFKPEFSDEENRFMVEMINKAKPDVLWIGMTAPKQEKWIYQHKNQIDVKFIGPIGAVFDFYSGNTKEAHPVIQKMGLYWLHRFIQNPLQLWKRNFISSPKFLLRTIYLTFKLKLIGINNKY